MAESLFKIRKGLTVANTSGSANLTPTELRVGATVVNSTIVSAAVLNTATFNTTSVNAVTVNAETHSVGASFTANSSLTNTAAINVTGQVNSATLYAATSANVGGNVQLTTSRLGIGNTSTNVIVDQTTVTVANTTSTSNLTPTQLRVGANVTVNTTAIQVGTGATNVVITSAGVTIGSGSIAMLNVEDQVVTGGARVTVKDLGNLSGATITPDPGDRSIQKITNNGAGTVLPGSNSGSYLLLVINTTGAGAITTSSWTKVDGTFNTTTTSKFLCHCTVVSDFTCMSILSVV